MSAYIFDGEAFAAFKLAALKNKIETAQVKPTLFVLMFDEDEVGKLYARLKAEAAQKVGIRFETVCVPISTSEAELNEILNKANNQANITGVMVQKPTKSLWHAQRLNSISFEQWWESITGSIKPSKDVDCLTRVNLDKLYAGESSLLPATAQACLEVLAVATQQFDKVSENWNQAFLFATLTEYLLAQNPKIGVVGRSELVGKPLATRLRQLGAQVELLGRNDPLEEILPLCDVVVSATGKSGLITGQMLKHNSIVIDVGSPRAEVVFTQAQKIAGFVTPVPGGVGPVTVACLMQSLCSFFNQS